MQGAHFGRAAAALVFLAATAGAWLVAPDLGAARRLTAPLALSFKSFSFEANNRI
jgi:hypothetical protein